MVCFEVCLAVSLGMVVAFEGSGDDGFRLCEAIQRFHQHIPCRVPDWHYLSLAYLLLALLLELSVLDF